MNHSSREFKWISSINGDKNILESLHQKMSWFYSSSDGRSSCQGMLEDQEASPKEQSLVEASVLDYLINFQVDNILEVGCSNGRIYKHLSSKGFKSNYAGVEVANYIIENNAEKYPKAHWQCASIYNLPFEDEVFNITCSFYVLEHLVFPENGLKEMLRVTQKKGQVILVFPDFIMDKRLASQQRGFRPVNVRQKVQNGYYLDALISLYDSKIRLPRVLRKSVKKFGPFSVNLQPVCLSNPSAMEADIDAVYIASKQEVESWALKQGYSVEYPSGKVGSFSTHTFMVIHKK